jgi:hypothetical protein
MKLGRTLALRGVVGSSAGEDLPSSDIRRRLLTGDGIVSLTIKARFKCIGCDKVVMRRLRLVAGTNFACLLEDFDWD